MPQKIPNVLLVINDLVMSADGGIFSNGGATSAKG
jgi:hypothetical protein